MFSPVGASRCIGARTVPVFPDRFGLPTRCGRRPSVLRPETSSSGKSPIAIGTSQQPLTRIFHRRWVARATCPFRRATSLAEARRQTSRVVSPRHDMVTVHAWSASCRPEQAGRRRAKAALWRAAKTDSLFHPSRRNQYEIFGLSPTRPRLLRVREKLPRGETPHGVPRHSSHASPRSILTP